MQIRKLLVLLLAATVFFGTASLPAYDGYGCESRECFEDGDAVFAAVSALPEKPGPVTAGEILSPAAGKPEHHPPAIEHPPRRPS